MAEIDLRERFPDMQPYKSPPMLARLNGCGFGMYGHRGDDDESGSYVKTWCFSLLWIPVLALRAYRLADAEGGWYFLGRVPLSGVAKVCNALVVLGLATLIGRTAWDSHTRTPGYIALKKIATADEHRDAGEVVQAARLYVSVASGKTEHVGAARDRLRALAGDPLDAAAPGKAAEVLTLIARMRGLPVLQDLPARALALADARGAQEPRGGLALLDVAQAQPGDARRVKLLERWIAAEPAEYPPVEQLALVYEAQGGIDACRTLLEKRRPLPERSEGARILGQIYVRDGRDDDAFALLEPYARARLEALHEAEKEYDRVWQSAWDREIRKLDRGDGPPAFYRRYDAAADDEAKQRVVQEHIFPVLKETKRVATAYEALQREAEVVPVALDIGVLRLRRARRTTDADARREELERAEQAFLAIRGLAGDTDEFRLFLGQVYHWMGRDAEGHALFEQLLAKHGRAPNVLLGVARTLREVGAHSEARTLTEEAYDAAKDDAARFEAAQLRALLPLDTDDTILWLERCDPASPWVDAMLNSARADRALGRGQDEAAAGYLARTIAAYEKMPDAGPTLNNLALACFRLYDATGDRDAFRRGVAAMGESLKLQPGDSVGLGNAATLLLEDAILDLVEDEIDLGRLRARGSFDLFDILSPDAAAARSWRERFANHPRAKEARGHADRAQLLAPRSAMHYELALSAARRARDLEGVRTIHARLQGVELDLVDAEKDALAAYRGEVRPQDREATAAALARFAEQAAALEGKPADPTFAAAAIAWTDTAISARLLGMAPDPRPFLQWIERAHGAAPTDGTSRTLMSALLLLGAEAVAPKSEAFARIWSRRDSVGHINAVTIGVFDPGPARDALLADPSVRRAVELAAQYRETFPDARIPVDWALLHGARPDVARPYAQVLAADEMLRLHREAQCRLRPFDGARAYWLHWLRLAAGDEAGAQEALAACAARGTPLPPR